MRTLSIAGFLLAVLSVWALPARATDTRDETREKLRATLVSAGARADVNVAFRQSEKEPYNFVGSMRSGMRNADYLEIVISVTKSDTIGFRVYPHYNGGYMNLNRAVRRDAFAKQLLYFSDQNFLFWGCDDVADCFSGYTFTLESGYPEDAIVIVLRSIRNTDKFVGMMRPNYDGSQPAPTPAPTATP